MLGLETIVQEDDTYRNKITLIEDLAEECLKNISEVFTNYTDHSINHSKSVIAILNKILFESGEKDVLSVLEVYILLAAAYLHDTGMADGVIKRDGRIVDEDEKTKIRKTHHELSAKFLKSYSKKHKNLIGNSNPIPNIEEICKVVIGHRKVDLNSTDYDDSPHNLEKIKVRFLAALLRLADELDILQYRARKSFLQNENDHDYESKLHHFKHWYVKACSIEEGVITVTYRFPEGYEKLYKSLFDQLIQKKIEEVLKETQKILHQNGISLILEDSTVSTSNQVEPMPQEVLDMARNEYKKISSERIFKENEEYQSVMEQPFFNTSGSVLTQSDPTSGVHHVKTQQ
jgi:HD superfamily phosphodiesterase